MHETAFLDESELGDAHCERLTWFLSSKFNVNMHIYIYQWGNLSGADFDWQASREGNDDSSAKKKLITIEDVAKLGESGISFSCFMSNGLY